MPNTIKNQISPFALQIDDAAKFSGLCRATLYNLAKQGKLRINRVAGRSLILRSDLEALLSPSDGREAA